MDKQELAKRLMATFLEELHEHVEAMNRDLLVLEREGTTEGERDEALKVLFRSAHSLKGAARAVNVSLIEQACHNMEDILSEVRDGSRTLEPPLFSLCFQFADAVHDAGMRLRDEQELDGGPLQQLMPALERANESDPTSAGADDAEGDIEVAATDAKLPSDAQQSKPEHAPVAAAVPRVASIRVAAKKLDALLAQNGELLVARRRIEQRSVDADALTDLFTAFRAEWNQLTKPLRQVLDRQKRSDERQRDGRLPRQTEMLFARNEDRLSQLEKHAERLATSMTADVRVLQQTCAALDDEVHAVRMLPFMEACGALERAVRDIAQATGKSVELAIRGQDVEVDRSVLEGLKDPLLHLVRNAVDHGIELPANRTNANKSPQGKVTVSAELRGGQVEVVVEDDGSGFDLQRIREKGLQQGLAVPQEEAEQAQMVFLPGFSTAKMVTDVSGRGVGLDVVESAVHALHGSIHVDFQSGLGSRFTITVPLTLTTLRCLLVRAANETYAIPTSSVHQLIRFDVEGLRTVSGRDVLLLGGSPTPVAALADILGEGSATLGGEGDKALAVVVGASDQRLALVVDELCAEQEILVKSLGARIRYARYVAGATLLPSGRVALVLNVPNVVNNALGKATRIDFTKRTVDQPDRPQPHLLVVDDSMTTRTLMKSILETAGYRVASAADGEQAWELLRGTRFDLVVSDVDMPRMNGFDLTARIRDSNELADLPVVLVTARATDDDRTRGVQVGASAYLVKSGFDQSTLLESIEQLV